MKLIKARYDLIFFFYFPFLLFSTALYWFCFDQFPLFSYANWLLTFLLFILIFLRASSKPLGGMVKEKASGKWLLKLFLSQLLINVLIWSFAQLVSYDLSLNQKLFNINLLSYSLGSGLFPWSFSILTALALGYFNYTYKNSGLYSAVYQPLYHNTHIDSIGVAVDSYMRLIPVFLIVFLLSLLTIGIIMMASQLSGINVTVGMKFQVVFINCLLLVFVTHRIFIKNLHHWSYLQIPTALILIGITVIISMLYLGLNYVADGLININPLLNIDLLKNTSDYQQAHIQIVINLLWWAFSAVNGGYIAFISREKTMRQVIGYSLAMFMAGLAVIFLLNHLQPQVSSTATFANVILIICSTLLLMFFLKKEVLTYLLRATIPTANPIKPRSTFRFFKILPFAIVSFVSLYFGMGLTVWSYLSVLGFLVPIMVIFIGFIALSMTLIRGDNAPLH